MDVRRELMKVKISFIRLILLSFFWFGYSSYLSAMTIIFLPAEITRIRSGQKGVALMIVLVTSSLVGGAVSPLFGYLSDVYDGKMVRSVGKRAPFVIIGVLGCSVSIILMGTFSVLDNFHLLWALWGAATFFISIAQGSYSAIIPDIVPREQYGVASGCMAFMMMLGTAVGGSLGFYYSLLGIGFNYLVYVIVSTLVISMSITLCSVTTGPYLTRNYAYETVQKNHCCATFFAGFVDPFKHNDFRWVFISRIFIGFGYTMVILFAQFYIEDIIPAPYQFLDIIDLGTDEKSATALFSTVVAGGAVLSSLIFGFLSDKIHKKTMVYISGVLQVLAITPLALPYFDEYFYFLVFGFFAGIGYGGYLSVDWALVCDVLPQAKWHGRDMGMWHFSWAIPQIVGPFISGFLLDGRTPYGYWIVYGITIVSVFLGTVLIKNVKLTKVSNEYVLDTFFSNETDSESPFFEEGADDQYLFQSHENKNQKQSNGKTDEVLNAFVSGQLNLDDIPSDSISFTFSSSE